MKGVAIRVKSCASISFHPKKAYYRFIMHISLLCKATNHKLLVMNFRIGKGRPFLRYQYNRSFDYCIVQTVLECVFSSRSLLIVAVLLRNVVALIVVARNVAVRRVSMAIKGIISGWCGPIEDSG